MQNRRYKISAIFLWSERAEKTVGKRRILPSKSVVTRRRKTSENAVGKRRILLSKSVVTCRRKTSENAVGKRGLSPSIYVGIRCR